MGFARGFTQGFGLVDDYEHRQFQQERQTKADNRAEELHGLQVQGVKNDLELFPLQKQAAEQQVEASKLGNEKAQFEVDHLAVNQRLSEQAKYAQLRAAKLAAQDAQWQMNARESLNLLNQIGITGELNSDMYDLIHKSSKKEGSLFAVWGEDLDRGYQINQDIDRYLNGQMTDEQAMPSIQAWLQPSADKVVGTKMQDGRRVMRAQVVGLKSGRNQEGKIGGTPMIQVTLDDGTTIVEPATELRLAQGGDAEKFIDMDSVYQRHFAERSVLGVLKATGMHDKLRTGIKGYYNTLNPPKMTELNEMTAKMFVGQMEELAKVQRGKVTNDGAFVPADPSAVRQQQKFVDDLAASNPQLAMSLGYTPPPQPEQIIKYAEGQTFKDEEAKEEFIRGVALGQIGGRDAMAYLQKFTTQAKKETPEPEGKGTTPTPTTDTKALLSSIISDQPNKTQNAQRNVSRNEQLISDTSKAVGKFADEFGKQYEHLNNATKGVKFEMEDY